MATLISHSPRETEELGFALGRDAREGEVFGLTGPLGAGKTQFVRGLARGLGITGRIPSPTFSLVHEHRSGRLPLFHLDLYRLESLEAILGAGLDLYLPPAEGVSVVEWFERWTGPTPPTLRLLRFQSLNESDRRIDYDLPRP